jgi:ubiquinone/menaquinone biosynthesis C-methylase UbiE
MNKYSVGHRPSAIGYMARRTAERNAQFALPYFLSGSSLLDCGCGPGSITLGLARHVAPGHVTGIDLEPSQVELARANAREAGLGNTCFEVANVCSLPFADEQFDLVFCHTVLCHLANAETAVSEMHRVLKRGGCIAIRDIMASRCVYWPESAKLLRGEALLQKVISHAGGDPDCGATLGRLLHEAGFSRVFMSASYDLARTLEEKPSYFASEGNLVENSAMGDICVAQGWVSREELSEIAEEWRRFGNMPDTLFALPFGEAIGWKV